MYPFYTPWKQKFRGFLMYSGVIEMEHWQTKKQTRNVIKNFIVAFLAVKKKKWWKYRISSNKRRVSNKRCPLISAAPLGIHIEISASL